MRIAVPVPLRIVAPAREVLAATLVRPVTAVAFAALLLLVVLRLAVNAALPTMAVAFLAPATALLLVAAVFRAGVALGPLALDERGEPRPLLRRHGFWVVALAIVSALPMLGAFSLVDPWETHYAEVAREMIERRDLFSPWWANEGWFMSKPVLTFWLEAASMVTFGVHTGPDQVLAGVAGAAARPEWAVRMPAFVLATTGAYALYNGVARTCGRRAGFLSAVILLTMPGYALLSHQALTDMPLVAGVAASVGLLLRALGTPDEAQSARWTVRMASRTLTIHAGHGLLLVFLVFTAPQLVALLLLHVHADASGLQLGLDQLLAGSPHACTLPGQPACAAVQLAHPRLQPIVQVAIWTPLVAWLTVRLARETRVARLFAIAAWTAAAFGAMAKGPAAFAIPAAAALVALAARRSWRPLLRLEILTGLGVSLVMVAPWYLAVFARHGRVFTDELVLRHMLGRTLEHLHDTNTGDDVGLTYFVKQLGYATFPWSGLVLAALFAAPSADDGSRRSHARALSFGAALAAFALVSSMGTKFHHYGLVVLPGAAMVAGLWLDERLGAAHSRRGLARAAGTAALLVGASLVVLLVARDLGATGVTAAAGTPGGAGPARLMQLMTYRYDRLWPDAGAFAPAIVVMGCAMALATAAAARRTWRRPALHAALGCGLAFAVVLLDVYAVGVGPDGGQREVFATYYAARSRDAGPVTPLVAYQLNWKGENFYSGNNVALFIGSGAPFQTYLRGRRDRNERVVYFVAERRRVKALRAELGATETFEELTPEDRSYEFSLVRATL